MKKYEVSYDLAKSSVDFSKATIYIQLDEQLLAEFNDMSGDERNEYIKKYGYLNIAGVNFDAIEIMHNTIRAQEILEEDETSIDYTEEHNTHGTDESIN